jgi:hypothetical protein
VQCLEQPRERRGPLVHAPDYRTRWLRAAAAGQWVLP